MLLLPSCLSRARGPARAQPPHGTGKERKEGSKDEGKRARAGHLQPGSATKPRPGVGSPFQPLPTPEHTNGTWRGAGEVPSGRADRLDVEVPHGHGEPRFQPGAPRQAPLGAHGVHGVRRLRRLQQRPRGAQQQERQQPAAPHRPASPHRPAGPHRARSEGSGAFSGPARPPLAPRPAGRPDGAGAGQSLKEASRGPGFPRAADSAFPGSPPPPPPSCPAMSPGRSGGESPAQPSPARVRRTAPAAGASPARGAQAQERVRSRAVPRSRGKYSTVKVLGERGAGSGPLVCGCLSRGVFLPCLWALCGPR